MYCIVAHFTHIRNCCFLLTQSFVNFQLDMRHNIPQTHSVQYERNAKSSEHRYHACANFSLSKFLGYLRVWLERLLQAVFELSFCIRAKLNGF